MAHRYCFLPVSLRPPLWLVERSSQNPGSCYSQQVTLAKYIVHVDVSESVCGIDLFVSHKLVKFGLIAWGATKICLGAAQGDCETHNGVHSTRVQWLSNGTR